jgi:hypothetical protein
MNARSGIASILALFLLTVAVAASVTQAEAATKTLVAQMKAVQPPDTSQGQAAMRQVDQLTTDIDNTVNAAKTALTQARANASAAAISATVATLAPQVQSFASGSLASALKSTDSCKSLGGS